MKQRIIVVHGWSAGPTHEWFPWLIAEMEPRGFEVIVPAMPDTDHPRIDDWVGHLATIVGDVRPDDIFVGHSIGCQTILRYLTQVPGAPVLKAIFVAGWVTLQNLENEEEWAIARPWLDTPIDWDVAKQRISSCVAIFSDTDPYVALDENKAFFADRLGATCIVEHDKGHFSEEHGVYELPIVRDLIIDIQS